MLRMLRMLRGCAAVVCFFSKHGAAPLASRAARRRATPVRSRPGTPGAAAMRRRAAPPPPRTRPGTPAAARWGSAKAPPVCMNRHDALVNYLGDNAGCCDATEESHNIDHHVRFQPGAARQPTLAHGRDSALYCRAARPNHPHVDRWSERLRILSEAEHAANCAPCHQPARGSKPPLDCPRSLAQSPGAP